LIISAFQFSYGFNAWLLGFGIVTPILLIIHGFAYSHIENSSWYREQMVPFISRVIATTEIETDRYVQYNRRCTRYILILGWLAILLCQWVWTFGLTVVMPFFVGDNLILRFIGELVGYAVIFGPFLLYFLILIAIAASVEKILRPRYKDIEPLFEIADKWVKETNRRAKESKSTKEEDTSPNN